MKGNIPFFAVKRHHYFKAAVLLCLLCSLVISACVTSTPTLTPTMAMPIPTIVSSGPCELAPGDTFPLSVTGVSGSGVTYSWSASRGNVTPSDGPSVLYTAPDTGGRDIVRVEARKDGQSSAATITCVVSTPVTLTPAISPTPPATLTPTISPTPTATLTPTIAPPPTGGYPKLEAEYGLCEDGGGKIIGTLYATGGNGKYSYTPSEIFEAQREVDEKVEVKSGDGQKRSTTINIDFDRVISNCSLPNPMRTTFLEVTSEIVPCFKGQPKIKVTLYPTGGDGQYLYTKSTVFDVQIDDRIPLVVTSGDGQTWTDSIYVSRNLIRNCITTKKPKDGDVVPDHPY
jgi:hypothetical protein